MKIFFPSFFSPAQDLAGPFPSSSSRPGLLAGPAAPLFPSFPFPGLGPAPLWPASASPRRSPHAPVAQLSGPLCFSLQRSAYAHPHALTLPPSRCDLAPSVSRSSSPSFSFPCSFLPLPADGAAMLGKLPARRAHMPSDRNHRVPACLPSTAPCPTYKDRAEPSPLPLL